MKKCGVRTQIKSWSFFFLSLQLPVDVNMLAADEKKIRLARYQPKKRVKIEDDLDDNFDANRYKHLWNKKK